MTPPTGQQHRRISFVALAVVALAFVAGVASLTALVGQFGRIYEAADWINHLMPFWVAGGLAACAGLLILPGRGRLLGALMALWLAATGGTRLLEAAPAATQAATGQPRLRIVQFNVLKTNAQPDRAAAWILAQDADVVALEEAAGDGARIIRLLQPAYPHAIDCLGGRGRCSTLLLSRTPFAEDGGLARGDPENRKTFSAAWARLGSPWSRTTVVGVHFGRPWPFGDQTRQAGQLAAFVNTRDKDRLIVVGDFNQTPWTYAMARQERALGLQRFSGTSASWPVRPLPGPLAGTIPPALAIDHIYGGRCWRALSVRRGPALGSDHRPIVADLTAVC